MSDLSIVCIYNNRNKYESELVASVSKQNINAVIIGIDNSSGLYKSCSQAYNSVINELSSEYVVFAHQDIILNSPNVLDEFLNRLKKINKGDLLGVAGVDIEKKVIVSSILHGSDSHPVSSNKIEDVCECETIDECFFGGRTETFKEYAFDELICDNWHLYAVELSLRVRSDNNHVFACCLDLLHTSTGVVSHDYCRNLFYLCKKYQNEYDVIRTTCSTCKTSFIPRSMYLIKRELARVIYR